MGDDHAQMRVGKAALLGQEIAEDRPHRRIRRDAGLGEEEAHPHRDDDDRHDHRADQERHDQPPIGHFRTGKPQCRDSAQRGGQDRRPKPDPERVLRRLHPGCALPDRRPPAAVAGGVGRRVAEGQECVVPAQRPARRVEGQHLRGEGEIGLGVERQRDHDQDRRDQEQEHQGADHQVGVVPDTLQRRGIGGKGHDVLLNPASAGRCRSDGRRASIEAGSRPAASRRWRRPATSSTSTCGS